jgi:hypothetical protein
MAYLRFHSSYCAVMAQLLHGSQLSFYGWITSDVVRSRNNRMDKLIGASKLSATNDSTWLRVNRTPRIRPRETQCCWLKEGHCQAICSHPKSGNTSKTKMKHTQSIAEGTRWKHVALFLAFLSLTVTGCNKQQPTSVRKANAKATWTFWQTIQEPLPRNTLYQRMSGFNAETENAQDLQAMGLLFRQLAESCRGKAGQITSARVADVDVDAATYGVKKAQVMIEFGKLLDGAAALTEKQSDLTSGETLLFDYVFAVARHADEGEDAWGNALKEQLVGKAKSFGNMQVEGKSLAAVMQGLTDAAGELQTIEMETRIALAQRYGKEFPTADVLAKQNPPPKPEMLSSESLNPMRQELMKNLVGRKIRTPADGTWTFDTMGEFQTFNVLRGTNYGDVVDFEVTTHVKGYFSGAEHNFRLLLTFQRNKEVVRLMIVKPLQPLPP